MYVVENNNNTASSTYKWSMLYNTFLFKNIERISISKISAKSTRYIVIYIPVFIDMLFFLLRVMYLHYLSLLDIR